MGSRRFSVECWIRFCDHKLDQSALVKLQNPLWASGVSEHLAVLVLQSLALGTIFEEYEEYVAEAVGNARGSCKIVI